MNIDFSAIGKGISSGLGDALGATKGAFVKKSPIETKLKEALSKANWGASGTLLADIARHTTNYDDFPVIMKAVWESLGHAGKNWKQIYKGLALLDSLIKNGAERVVDDARHHTYQIKTLCDFSYYEDGVDRGAGVREKAKLLTALLKDNDRIREEREKAKSLRDKIGGSMSNTDSGGYRGSSSGRGDGGYEDSSSRRKSLQYESDDDSSTTKKKKKKKKKKNHKVNDNNFSDGFSDDDNERDVSPLPEKKKKNKDKHYVSDDENDDEEEEVSTKKKSKKEKKKKKKKSKNDDPIRMDDTSFFGDEKATGTSTVSDDLFVDDWNTGVSAAPIATADDDFFGPTTTPVASVTPSDDFDFFGGGGGNTNASASNPTLAASTSNSTDMFGDFNSATTATTVSASSGGLTDDLFGGYSGGTTVPVFPTSTPSGNDLFNDPFGVSATPSYGASAPVVASLSNNVSNAFTGLISLDSLSLNSKEKPTPPAPAQNTPSSMQYGASHSGMHPVRVGMMPVRPVFPQGGAGGYYGGVPPPQQAMTGMSPSVYGGSHAPPVNMNGYGNMRPPAPGGGYRAPTSNSSSKPMQGVQIPGYGGYPGQNNNTNTPGVSSSSSSSIDDWGF